MPITAPRTTREMVMPDDTPRITMICSRPCPAIDMMVSNKQQARERHPGIDEPLHQEVQLAADEPRGAADQHRNHHVQGGRRQADEQRDARPVDQATQEVAPELVGAQRVLARRALQPVGQRHLVGVVPRQVRCEDADQDQRQQHHAAERTQGLLLDEPSRPPTQ